MSNPDEIKLEPCPFCGSEVETIDPIGIAVFHKDNPKCPLFKIGVNIMGWNTRPIETKLQAEIAKREAAWGEMWKENERLVKVVAEHVAVKLRAGAMRGPIKL